MYCTFCASGIKSKNITLTSVISLLYILSFFRHYFHFHIITYTYIMWGKKIEKYDCLDLYHAQCFPQCLLFVSPVLWENNSYLENLFSSKSRKLYQQNTSVVLVSVKNSAHLSADVQISPEIDQFRSWITGVLAFLKKT